MINGYHNLNENINNTLSLIKKLKMHQKNKNMEWSKLVMLLIV
jgi:hypothetical protein